MSTCHPAPSRRPPATRARRAAPTPRERVESRAGPGESGGARAAWAPRRDRAATEPRASGGPLGCPSEGLTGPSSPGLNVKLPFLPRDSKLLPKTPPSQREVSGEAPGTQECHNSPGLASCVGVRETGKLVFPRN